MSNHLAIATVTATLYNIIDQGKESAGVSVTTRPPDEARSDNGNGNQVNIFLYHTELNEAWRNRDMPRQVQPGELGHPPLALRLYYLITAYGASDDEIAAHRVLGRAMANLHDHPILGPEEFRDANAALVGSNLHEQIERVRITPQSLTLDDMYKLWSSFQSAYRPSTAYQVSVVLIESERAALAPLPVLTRGEEDRGVGAQADLVPPYPAITAIEPPGRQPAARVDDAITVRGYHLDGDAVTVILHHPREDGAIELAPEPGGTDRDIRVVLPATLPAGSAPWRAGIYAVSAAVQRGSDPARITNEMPLAVVPRITDIVPAVADLAITSSLTIICTPEVLPGQRPRLLLGDRVIVADELAGPSSSLEFSLAGLVAGEYFVRLRVDGVDSLLVDRSQTPPVFDATQKVTLT